MGSHPAGTGNILILKRDNCVLHAEDGVSEGNLRPSRWPSPIK